METTEKTGLKLTTVFVETIIDLPLATVWKAWTDAETFRKWWGPAAYTCPYCEIELKVGGQNLNCMRSPEGKDVWSTGTYEEIVPMKKIVYIDSFSNSLGDPVLPSYYEIPGEWGEEMKVTINMEDKGGKTRLVMVQEGIPEEMHDDCMIGWKQSFEKMEVSLEK